MTSGTESATPSASADVDRQRHLCFQAIQLMQTLYSLLIRQFGWKRAPKRDRRIVLRAVARTRRRVNALLNLESGNAQS